MKVLLSVVAALTLIAGCSEDGERVTEADLATLLANTTRVQFHTLRFKGSADLRANKSAYLKIPGLGEDTGTWWLDGDTVCTKWNEALRGKTTCAYLERYEDGSYTARNPGTGAQLGRFQIGSP